MTLASLQSIRNGKSSRKSATLYHRKRIALTRWETAMPARIAHLYTTFVSFLGFRANSKREQNHGQILDGSIEQSNPGNKAAGPLPKSEGAVDELHVIFTQHLSKFPAQEQKRRWDALEEYVNKFGTAGTPAKN